MASVIVKARNGQQIRTIGEFLEIIKPLFGREREKKELAKVFQALRIEVNQEMEALKEMLLAATEALKPGGRVAILTFHSGEDKLVKKALKAGYKEGIYSEYARDVVRPSAQECAQNGRARSTKMRWAVKAE